VGYEFWLSGGLEAVAAELGRSPHASPAVFSVHAEDIRAFELWILLGSLTDRY
jgi:hypothetical protein